MGNKLIALTGGIGSGKSEALLILKNAGYKTISCDEVTKSLYKKRKVLKTLKKEFPSAIKGKLFLKADKGEISRIAFSDKVKYKFLTDYLTMLTFDTVMDTVKKMSGKIIVEVPLLFENHKENYFDKVIVILRDKKARTNAVKTRSNLTEEQVKERMNSQFDYQGEFPENCIVITNDGTKEELKEKVLSAVKEL